MDTAQSDSEQAVQEFKPSRTRWLQWLVGYLAFYLLAAIVFHFIGIMSLSSSTLIGAITSAVWILLWDVGGFRDYVVAITDDTISGRSASGWSHVSFEIAQIDWSKTMRSSWLDKIDGTRRVHSMGGEVVLLSGLMFDKKQIRAIFERIGY